jgi:hypothetical protein
MPGVHRSIHGPESAGDDAALIQRKASFDTRRADQSLVAPDGTGPGPLIPSEPVRVRPPARSSCIRSSTAERHVHTVEVGGSAPPGCTWGTSCPQHGGWSRMERRVVVTHPAGSSILLIHPGSTDPKHRSGEGWRPHGSHTPEDLRSVRSAATGAGPVAQDGLINHPRRGQHPGPQPSGPCSPNGRGSWPKPSVCTFESCRGYRAGDARVAERPLRTRERESSTLSTGSKGPRPEPPSVVTIGTPARRAGALCERADPLPARTRQSTTTQSGALFGCHCDYADGK